jgi:endo-1,4-beta-xylanase
MKLKYYALIVTLGLLSANCFSQPTTSTAQEEDTKGLKDYYKDYFSVGVAVSPQVLKGPEAALIKKHFNSMTAENAMKMGPIHPEENKYNWQPADEIVDFAMANGMKMRGHTLCWHNQTPNWLFKDEQGKEVTKEVLLKRLKDHITTVVTRYKGKIYAWDVVNEVIDDNDSKFYRESLWYKICGEDYIAKAFEYAHEADPNALLFYNDYNTESTGKRERIYTMVKKLMDAKVPIHGVGLQGHWSIYQPTGAAVRESIEKFASLGLIVQVTELDVSVYQSEHERRDRKENEDDTFTEEREQKQIEQYKTFFKVFRENKDKLTSVTFWNVSDKRSWLDNFPVRGRKNYPLLFDQELKPKKAYWEVVKF